MSGKGTKLLPLCMLLLLIAGVFMPHAAFSLQDQKLAAQTESRVLSGIEFTLHEGGGVKQTLSLLSSGYTKIMLQEGNNLTQQEAEAAAREAVDRLTQEGLLPDFTPKSTLPPIIFAAISNSDRSNSAVIWEYTFTGDAQSRCTIWIDDDATKKMVSVSYVADGRTSTGTVPTVETAKAPLAERWSAFLQEYYGLAWVSVEKSYKNESKDIFTLKLTWMKEESIVSCKLPLMLHSNDVFFCW